MRAIIFLAIVGVAFGNLCKGVNNINAAFAAARVGSVAIFGNSCPSFDFDSVALSGACKRLTKQGTCYGLKAASHFNTDVVSYEQLAADVPNMEKLATVACAEVAGCFEQVKSAIQACAAKNPNFLDQTIAAAEALYKKDFESQARDFAEARQGSLLGEIITMVMGKFSSADDIRMFINEQLNDQRQADASEAYEQAKNLAQGWCDDGCTSSTARFLEGIFGHMNGGGCDDASVFCGECQSRAESYFARNQLPCCIEKVVQRGIEAYDYVIDNYSLDLEAYADAFEESVSASAFAEAVAIKDRVVEEFECVSAVYSENKPECA